jgi:hypothetical protein
MMQGDSGGLATQECSICLSESAGGWDWMSKPTGIGKEKRSGTPKAREEVRGAKAQGKEPDEKERGEGDA